MKIEIWYTVKTCHGNIKECSRIVRVPSSVKQINSNTCFRIMHDWLIRVERITVYQNQVLDWKRRRKLVDYSHCDYIISSLTIKGWSLVIDVDVLDFICSKL